VHGDEPRGHCARGVRYRRLARDDLRHHALAGNRGCDAGWAVRTPDPRR
jgi:hypothetical protein